jgi:small conductance mechanosensitive channel
MMNTIAQTEGANPVEVATKSIEGVTNLVDQAKTWLTANGLTFGSNLLAAIVVYVVGRWAANLVRSAIQKIFSGRGLDSTVATYAGNIVYAIIMIMVMITALGKLGVPTAQFAAIIAAAGLAIGLALQGNLANFASGFMLVFFRPIKVGDYISAGGAEGTVEEIGIFTSTLNTLDNKKVVVPNSSITGGNIVNFSANANRVVCVPVSVSPQNDPAAVGQALLAAAAENELVLKDPAPVAVITQLGEGKFIMELRVNCAATNYWSTLFTLYAGVKNHLESAQVIPFLPHQAVKLIQP